MYRIGCGYLSTIITMRLNLLNEQSPKNDILISCGYQKSFLKVSELLQTIKYLNLKEFFMK
jgi:hypothetical protein